MSPARLALALALALPACGAPPSSEADAGAADAGSGFGAKPLTTVQSDSGALKIDVVSNPQPPIRGQDRFRLLITDAQGSTAPGLTVAVQPWMAEMGHGSSVTPVVTEVEPGVYEVSDVYMAMPGTWQLRVTVSGKVSDHAAPQFQIP